MNPSERRPIDLTLRIIIGIVLAILMLLFLFVPSLRRPTNISWALIGLFLATGAAGQALARRRPIVARVLNRISIIAIVLSVVYTMMLLFT
jgi:hypothetical protein